MLRLIVAFGRLSLLAVAAAAYCYLGAQGVVTTVVGRDWVFPVSTERALDAPLSSFASELAIDRSGNMYIADSGNQIVFRIAPDQDISIVAGNGLAGYSGDGGDARSASLNFPGGVAVDRDNNVYIADTRNHRIRKVTPDGIITTIAGGNGDFNGGYSGDGGPALQAALSYPISTAVDSRGQVYFFDSNNYVIRKIDLQGQITTWAGNGTTGTPTTFKRPATEMSLGSDLSLFFAADDSLYVSDGDNNCVWAIASNGILYLAAGIPGVGGELDNVPGITAMAYPTGIFVQNGELFFADYVVNKVKKVRSDGSAITLASGPLGYAGDGGPATAAAMKGPKSPVLDAAGNVYFLDSGNQRIRVIRLDGTIQTVAGNGRYRFSPDGSKALETYLSEPLGIAADKRGGIAIADGLNNRVLKVNQDGSVSTVVGNGTGGAPVREGPAKDSPMDSPIHVAIQSDDSIIFGTRGNRVYQVTPDGMLKFLAGTGSKGFSGDGGPAVAAKLTLPVGVAADNNGNTFIADEGNNRVRRVGPDGTISTYAGNGHASLSDYTGPATAAGLFLPFALATDRIGNVYFSDLGDRVRVVTPDGSMRTVAGTGENGFSGDGGPATQAMLGGVNGIQVDDSGNVYLADDSRIRVVDTNGVIRTLAGNGVPGGYSGDGKSALETSLVGMVDVAIGPTGAIYLLDYFEGKVRMILPTAPLAQPISPQDYKLSATSAGAKASVTVLVTALQSTLSPSQVVGVEIRATVDDTGAGWLTVTPSSGGTPALLEIAADPANLAPGDYTATVTIHLPAANPTDQVLTVHLHVDTALPSQLAIDAQSRQLSYPYTKGTSARAQKLNVSNAGGGILNFTTSITLNSGRQASWLSINPAIGRATPSTAAVLTVTADPGSLPIGTYTGKITITNTSQAGDVITIPITMTVSNNRKALLLSQTGVSFTAVEKGGIIPPQDFGVINIGLDALNWTVSTSVLGNVPKWLSATAADGTQQGVTLADPSAVVPLVTVRADASLLSAGDYYGQVKVEVPGAANTPQVVTVFLRVLSRGSDLAPVLRPSELIFTGVAGQSSPGSQDILVYDPTGTNKSYRLGRSTTDGYNWLITSPNDATVAGDRPTRLVVQPMTGTLGTGTYRGAITVQFSDGRVQVVNVTFIVTGPMPASGGQTALPRITRRRDATDVTDVTCQATTLVPALTTLSNNFEVPAGWPVGLRVVVSDDCGNPLDSGKVVVTFSSGYVPLGLQSLRQGRWDGTWSTKNQQLAQITVTVTATSADGKLTGTRVLNGGLGAVRDRPAVADDGVVSEMSPVPQIPLAPGSRIAILGQRLSNTNSGGTTPLLTELGGTIVTIAGQPLFLEQTSDGQVNAVVPFGLEINTILQLLVQRDYTYANPVYVNMAPAQPAIVVDGAGKPAIADAAGKTVGPQNPAKQGQTIAIQCTGLGAVDGNVDFSVPLDAGRVVNTVEPTTVNIAGKDAVVQSTVLMPGQIGIYQITAVVPDGVAGGDLTLTVTAGGQTSPAVLLANE